MRNKKNIQSELEAFMVDYQRLVVENDRLMRERDEAQFRLSVTKDLYKQQIKRVTRLQNENDRLLSCMHHGVEAMMENQKNFTN